MRFRFLGDGDCPDWLLVSIHALSRITVVKFRIVGLTVARHLGEEEIKKFMNDPKIELDDVEPMIAALEMIFTSSARYAVSPASLNKELQQLGLPREHSAVLAKLHTKYSPEITATLSSQSLRINRLLSIDVFTCNDLPPASTISVKFEKFNASDEYFTVNITKTDARVLLTELRKLKSHMALFSIHST